MIEHVNRVRKQLAYLPRSIRMVWAAAPALTTVWGALIVVQGLLPVATVFLTKLLVDSLTVAIGETDNPAGFSDALLYLIAMAAVLIIAAGLKALMRLIQTAQAEIVQDHIKDQVHHKAISLDLSYFESPNYYDMLHRASIDAVNKPLTLIQSIGSITQSVITLIAMLGILATLSVWLPVVLAISSLPALYVAINSSVQQHQLYMWRTERFRLAHYYSRTLTERDFASEVRLFALGHYFRSRYTDLRKMLRKEQIALARKHSIAEFLAALTGLAAMGVTIAWTAGSVVRTGGTLGDLAFIYQAFNQGQKIIQTLLANIRQFYTSLLFIENLFAFLELKPDVPQPVMPADKPSRISSELRLENVSFRYPGSERDSLQNFNLTIPVNKVVAIVGENGAGKSTLIKLLTRLYDPTAGTVQVDGNDLRDLPLDQVRKMFTVMFQSPVQYQQSVSDNIALGDWQRSPADAEVEKAAIDSGADIPVSHLPKGYDTILGKLFGGSELSGGEWQRVSLARAFLRAAPVIILDEPTSAMDSWAEADWMDRFRSLTDNRTALIITHRFTTAMRADIIHVMSEGQIIESGTHSELLAMNGHYAESWYRQTSTTPVQ